MTQDEIIEMARQHFCRIEYDNGNVHEGYEFSLEELEAFATLVAAEEREACAVIAFNADTYIQAAAAIRARGQA